MELLSTDQGLDVLRGAVNAAHASHAGLLEARELMAADLAWVERAVAAAAADGASPGADAAAHLAASGGKRVRALCVLLACACYGPVTPAARELAAVAEMVHAATLLHDDVIDDGDERRGLPTSRRVFGNAVSVLAGDLLLTHALDRTARAAPSALPDLLVTLRRLVDGEIIQLRGRTEIDLSEATYQRIVSGKTASLFGWAARAGGQLGGAPAAHLDGLVSFGEHLGVAFQLVDDTLDYDGDARLTGKTLLADLNEGKVTLPLALACASTPSLAAEIARVRAGDAEAAARVAAAVRASGSCREVRRRAAVATDAALAALASAPRSAARALLERVANDLTARDA
jgi:octaprenyl-diphosphate synthase